MLKSFCIKTNNKKILNYLLISLEKISLNDLYTSNLKFKLYNNIIVHYKGNNLVKFYSEFSRIISSCIIEFYEKDIIKHIINCNYFYFTSAEQRKIFDIVNTYLANNEIDECNLRQSSIDIACIEYFSNNKSCVLDGFVNFRINDYIKILDYIVDLAVNKFVIDREYLEFIDLLKCYINSKSCNASLVHIVYHNQESMLLDEFKKNINIDNTVLDSKYVSDISFSSNDYTLNALLTLLPQKIYIHLVDSYEDEFINTLKLIFNDRVYICNDCSICRAYKYAKTDYNLQ